MNINNDSLQKREKYKRVKLISKKALGTEEYLVNYIPENNDKNSNVRQIFFIEREINISKRLQDLTEEEKINQKIKIRKQIFDEITVVRKLNNNYILKIVDSFETEESVHLILEYYQSDLAELLKSQSQIKKYFPENLIIHYFTQICLAVNYIHKKKLLHRNINPSNIFIVSNKYIKLGNFDLSRILFTSSEKSITFIGNTWTDYMSPEMSMNLPYSYKNDIWSLGILLYHLMTLSCPFTYQEIINIRNTKKIDPHILINKISKSYSKQLINLVVSLLKPFPAERPEIEEFINSYFTIKNKAYQLGYKPPNNNKEEKLNFNNNMIIVRNKFDNKALNERKTFFKPKITFNCSLSSSSKSDLAEALGKKFECKECKIIAERKKEQEKGGKKKEREVFLSKKINNQESLNLNSNKDQRNDDTTKKKSFLPSINISYYSNIGMKLNDARNIMENNYSFKIGDIIDPGANDPEYSIPSISVYPSNGPTNKFNQNNSKLMLVPLVRTSKNSISSSNIGDKYIDSRSKNLSFYNDASSSGIKVHRVNTSTKNKISSIDSLKDRYKNVEENSSNYSNSNNKFPKLIDKNESLSIV